MAFGSGFTAIQILPSDEECDYTKRDFFRFGNNYPLLIKWKSKDTLIVKCLGDGSLAERQPFKRDTLKWKDWTFEVEYNSVFSSGTNGTHEVKSYQVNSNSISFKTDKETLHFGNNEVALELDSNQISLRHFRVDTFKSKTGFSLADYKFNMDENYSPKDFYGLQPFLKAKP